MKIIVIAIGLLLGLASQYVSAACANNKPFCACNQSGDVCVGCLNSGGLICGMRLQIKVWNTEASGTKGVSSMSAKSTPKGVGATKTKEIEIRKCSDLQKSSDFKKLEKQQKQDVMRFCEKELKKAKKQLSLKK